MLRSIPVARVLCLSLALFGANACGGGGSGDGGPTPPQETAPSLRIGDVELAPGASTAKLDVALVGEAPFPVMVQFELVGNPAELTFDPAVTPLAATHRLDAHLVAPGRLRVVLGDATGRPGTPLPVGPLLQVGVEVLPGAGTGPFEVRLEGALASDALGAAPAFDDAPRTAELHRR